MKRLSVTLACDDYDRTQALLDGTVTPEGMELTYLPVMMPEPAFRMLHYGEFEASEMSLSWYTRTLFSDPRPFIAIPVFPSRMFRHSCIYVNVNSGLDDPSDLVGKRVGCPEYQMTAAVWIKGILVDQYGVPAESVNYVTGGLEQPGRTEVALNLPERFNVRPIPADRTLSEMLDAGEIDAIYTAHAPSCFEKHSPNVRRLFENHGSVEREYFAKTRIFPIMHVIVIRQDFYEAHRWVAQSLTKAFNESKRIAMHELAEQTALKVSLPWLIDNVEEAQRAAGTDDYWPYGLSANHETLTTFLRYSHEQGLIPREVTPEELFAPETITTALI